MAELSFIQPAISLTKGRYEVIIDFVKNMTQHSLSTPKAKEALLNQWKILYPIGNEVVLGTDALSCESTIRAKLRGFDTCPTVFLDKPGYLATQSLSAILAQTTSDRRRGIIVCLTPDAYDYVQTRSLPPYRCVIVSPDDLPKILKDNRNLYRIIRDQFPSAKLSPFSISDPTQGPMFFGRKRKLHSLIDDDQDFAICGPGGIGKSSLLHQMKWELRQQRNVRHERIVVVDLIATSSIEQAAHEIAKAIQNSSRANDTYLAGLDLFLKHVKNSDPRFSDGPIDLIVDEADAVLASDCQAKDSSGNIYPLMRALRLARHTGSIRLTISGRHETKKLLNDPKNPFAVEQNPQSKSISRFQLIELAALSEREASELLFEPLEQLGYLAKFHGRDTLIERLRGCRGIPFYVQQLGREICKESPQ